MEFAGIAHVTLTVSNFDACLKFYDRLMTHIGMRRYVESPHFVGWFADECMFVIGTPRPPAIDFRSGAPDCITCRFARAAAPKWIRATRCSRRSALKLFSPPNRVRFGRDTIRSCAKIPTAPGSK